MDNFNNEDMERVRKKYLRDLNNIQYKKGKEREKTKTPNFTRRNIRNFNSDDTIYIKKMVTGFSHFIFCKFISFEKGIVKALPIAVEPDWAKRTYFSPLNVPKEITARIIKCGLRDEEGKFHWFTKEGFAG